MLDCVSPESLCVVGLPSELAPACANVTRAGNIKLPQTLPSCQSEVCNITKSTSPSVFSYLRTSVVTSARSYASTLVTSPSGSLFNRKGNVRSCNDLLGHSPQPSLKFGTGGHMASDTKYGVSCRGLNIKSPCSTSLGQKSVTLHKPSGAKAPVA